METLPITARSFEKDYHINGDNFERSYMEAHGRKGCLVAIVKGTKAKEVTSVLKNFVEVVFVEVAGENIDRFVLLQERINNIIWIQPVVEYQDGLFRFKHKAAMEDVSESH